MGKRERGSVWAALALCLWAGCEGKPRTPAERGRAVYVAYNCRTCHRIGGEGGSVGPDLTFVGFRKSAAFLDLWLRDPRAWQPSTKMPFFNFNEATRRDLVAYLATLQGQAYASSKPWDAPSLKADPKLRGRELFERAGCSTCHGKAGAGGFPNNNVPGGKIPALRETAGTYTRDELIRKIKTGVPHPQKQDAAGPEPMLSMPPWGQKLDDEEIGALADYLLSISAKKGADW